MRLGPYAHLFNDEESVYIVAQGYVIHKKKREQFSHSRFRYKNSGGYILD